MKKFIFSLLVLITIAPLQHTASTQPPYEIQTEDLIVLDIQRELNYKTITKETAPTILSILDTAVHNAISFHAQELSENMNTEGDNFYEKLIKPALDFSELFHIKTNIYRQPVHIDVIYFYIFSRFFPKKAHDFFTLGANAHKNLKKQSLECLTKEETLSLMLAWMQNIRNGMAEILKHED